MPIPRPVGFDLIFPLEYLKPVLVFSLLTVGVLVSLLYYLNRYTHRRYFGIWATGWAFFGVWLGLCVVQQATGGSSRLTMVEQWCLGTTAVFQIWASGRFYNQTVRKTTFGLFFGFLFVWSYVGAYKVVDPFLLQVPMFGLITLASLMTAWCFFRFYRRRQCVGAGMAALGFAAWGLLMLSFPFLLQSSPLVCTAFFASAVLQLFLAVSMVVLVLEELRGSATSALKRAGAQKSETSSFQAKIAAMEERYRILFDHAQQGILITTAKDLKVLELNQTARRLLGLAGESLPETPLHRFFQQKPPAQGASKFEVPQEPERLPQSGPEWFDWLRRHPLISLMRVDGSAVAIEVSAASVVYQDRPAYQFFIRELTERARLEQQLRQAEKLSAMGQMISGIAHELNNPLAVVKGYLELILGRHQLNEQTRADLEKVAQESNRAAKIVSNFLTFARQRPPDLQPVNLNEIILQVLDMRQFELKAMGINLQLNLGPQLPVTLADSDQIQQVLINLVNNALQAMADLPGPGRLCLSSRVRDRMIEIRVEDSGAGVPDHLVSRIFEPFFTTKEVGTGTGLGLSISHTIMADLHGGIGYERTVDGGACFVLEFPVAADQTVVAVCAKPIAQPALLPKPSAVLPEPEAMPEGPAHILVLDDEKALAEMLGEMLSLIGYVPTLSHAAHHALELTEARRFDLIISDIRMPNMDGRKFYQTVKERNPALARRIIFLTGDVMNEDTLTFMQQTGNLHLSKPFRLSEIEEVVGRVLSELRPAARC